MDKVKELHSRIDVSIRMLEMLKVTGVRELYGYGKNCDETIVELNQEAIKRTRLMINDILQGKIRFTEGI